MREYAGRRWSLAREYPMEIFGMPVVLAATGLILFFIGLAGVDDLLWRFLLVCSAYVLWIVALVNAIVNLLFLRPDRYQA